jgi:hypothetical protein
LTPHGDQLSTTYDPHSRRCLPSAARQPSYAIRVTATVVQAHLEIAAGAELNQPLQDGDNAIGSIGAVLRWTIGHWARFVCPRSSGTTGVG